MSAGLRFQERPDMSTSDPRLFTEMAEDDPDKLEVWLDGEVIYSFTHDEIGWSGISSIENLIDAINQNL